MLVAWISAFQNYIFCLGLDIRVPDIVDSYLLYAGFSLLDKDTVIDFDSIDSEIARIDIDDSDAMPKAWKLQGFDSQNVKQWFDEQPSDRKMRLCKDMIIKKLSKNNAVNDRDLEVYVDRIIQNLTED